MRTIDLSGPDGNAWALMGMASKWGKQLGWERKEIDDVLEDMRSGDYDHLVGVMRHHFNSVAEFVMYDDNNYEDDYEDDYTE